MNEKFEEEKTLNAIRKLLKFRFENVKPVISNETSNRFIVFVGKFEYSMLLCFALTTTQTMQWKKWFDYDSKSIYQQKQQQQLYVIIDI